MRLIKEEALPGPEERLRQAEAAAEELERAGSCGSALIISPIRTIP